MASKNGFTSSDLSVNCQLTSRDEKWMANYEALKAYIDEHHHLPPKNAPLGAKYLLNWSKYVRRTIKEGTIDEWKVSIP